MDVHHVYALTQIHHLLFLFLLTYFFVHLMPLILQAYYVIYHQLSHLDLYLLVVFLLVNKHNHYYVNHHILLHVCLNCFLNHFYSSLINLLINVIQYLIDKIPSIFVVYVPIQIYHLLHHQYDRMSLNLLSLFVFPMDKHVNHMYLDHHLS